MNKVLSSASGFYAYIQAKILSLFLVRLKYVFTTSVGFTIEQCIQIYVDIEETIFKLDTIFFLLKTEIWKTQERYSQHFRII